MEMQCPYCSKVQGDSWERVPREEEIQACDSCEKNFSVRTDTVFVTYSNCEANKMEHDFKEAEYHPKFFMCENCEKCEQR